jgi:hypothetical protein
MELQRPVAPEAARAALHGALLPIAHHESIANAPDLYLQVDLDDRIELPFYTLTDPDREPEAVRPDPTGWAFIVRTRLTDTFNSRFSLAFLAETPTGFRFTHMTHGWLPKLLVEGAKHIADVNRSLTGIFVPALLSVFGSRSTSLWLQDSTTRINGNDWIIRLFFHQLGELAQPDVDFRAESFAEFQERIASARSATFTNNAPRSAHLPSERFENAPLPNRKDYIK